MNSLNIITARVSPSSSPNQSRSNSIGSIGILPSEDEKAEADEKANGDTEPFPTGSFGETNDENSETTPLLRESKGQRTGWWHTIPRGIATGILGSLRWVLATIASPGVYLVACFYDESGQFAPWFQMKKAFGVRVTPKPTAVGGNMAMSESHLSPPPPSSGSSTSGLSESEAEESSKRHTRSKSQPEEISPSRRSIRIKLHNDEAMQRRKHKKTQSALVRTKGEIDGDLSAHLKSPTSPIAALTRYPKTPAPPRPLIPRRQPSYLNLEPSRKQLKTLILDLDETLIHSMSKGGRMSTGHMVEVRLNAASLGMGGGGGGQGQVGQHPILYWVNKRPHCDEFLRRVCKWFNLVIFTASVQEYADPVIDWLEQERKFFSARYYRQHCTFRQGAYIKDLSSVEPDLSKVMILDNSPLSYLFHQDNAIPIQGWINDPTDSDLMHLVPLLEGLQYVHDVRALLALRGGEDGHHMA